MPDDWSREEVEPVVIDYLEMLLKERRGEKINKSEHNRRLRNILTTRSHGSVEFKHQNISSVLQELGYPWIDGYKPRANAQNLLREVVEERLSHFPVLDDVIRQQVTAEVSVPVTLPDLLSILVPRPQLPKKERLKTEPITRKTKPRKPNYLEMEARNRSLGHAGEELVARFERERLWRAGYKSLSDRVEHVSSTKGDGLGYDVLSFGNDGRERWIEVKTTQFGGLTPFFASRREVEVSNDFSHQFNLYRLFHFNVRPKLFTLPGSLTESCRLEAELFKAFIQSSEG